MSNEKYKILLIDDDNENIQLIKRKLSINKFEYFSSENGSEGYNIAVEVIPDIILLDWQMPDLDGIEVLKMLKKNALTSSIPVVMITGVMRDSDHLKTAFEAGASDFLRKPVNSTELDARINSIIRFKKENARRLELEVLLLNQKNDSLKKEIVQKQKTLSELSLQISLSGEIVEEFIEGIRINIKNKNQLMCESEIESMIVKFKKKMFDINWSSFEIKFSEAHGEFIGLLKSRFPNLTENDLKICSLIRMDLSSAQISSIVFISYEGVRKARTRLRKKLQLESNVDLTEFLKSIG